MPVIGLPKILESALSNILDDLTVSSWNIKSGDDNMQVWIRFKTNMDTDTALDNTNVTYRKMPPSQQKRNKIRAMGNDNMKNHDIGVQSTLHSHNKQSNSLIENELQQSQFTGMGRLSFVFNRLD